MVCTHRLDAIAAALYSMHVHCSITVVATLIACIGRAASQAQSRSRCGFVRASPASLIPPRYLVPNHENHVHVNNRFGSEAWFDVVRRHPRVRGGGEPRCQAAPQGLCRRCHHVIRSFHNGGLWKHAARPLRRHRHPRGVPILPTATAPSSPDAAAVNLGGSACSLLFI